MRVFSFFPPPPRGEAFGVWLAFLAAFGFSMKAIFVKLAYVWPVDAIVLLFLRMGISLPVFAVIAWKCRKDTPALSRRDWGALVILGVLGYYGSSILDFVALRYISAALERLVLYTYPTLTLLIAWALYRRAPAGREFFSLALTYLGIGLAFAHDLNLAEEGQKIWLGAALVFASSLTYALYLTGSAHLIARLGSRRFTALVMTASAIGVILHFLSRQPLTELPTALALPWQVYALCGAMAVFSTLLPVFMLSAAVMSIGAPRAALIGSVGPLVTIFLGWRWLDERLSIHQAIGAALVLSGVLLVSLKKRKAPE
ncbi:MAG: DMT family transporter [Zoogloeaceae bacterium]|jgi:drug/metabolite transporter (DMT)-like permease|nr:DMT family transporter [Zoogloeaceae bacterium]